MTTGTAKHALKVGDSVRHRETGEIRQVIALYPVDRGVNLNKTIGDFHSWNEEELEKLT